MTGALGFYLARIYNPSNEIFDDRREHDSFDPAFGELAQQQKKTTATSKTTT
jgi:hypothetical protein